MSADIISFTVLRSTDLAFLSGVSSFAQTNLQQGSSFVFNDNDPSLSIGSLYFYKIQSQNLACGGSSYCGGSAVTNITVVGECKALRLESAPFRTQSADTSARTDTDPRRAGVPSAPTNATATYVVGQALCLRVQWGLPNNTGLGPGSTLQPVTQYLLRTTGISHDVALPPNQTAYLVCGLQAGLPHALLPSLPLPLS